MDDEKDLGILKLEETSRTYFFPDGSKFIISDAVKCYINKINTHQLITKQGEVYIVPYKWLTMKYIPIVKGEESKK